MIDLIFTVETLEELVNGHAARERDVDHEVPGVDNFLLEGVLVPRLVLLPALPRYLSKGFMKLIRASQDHFFCIGYVTSDHTR